MATQPDNLIGSVVQQTQPLRFFPAHDGIRPGKLAQLSADTELPHGTPLAFDAGNTEWNVFDEAIPAIDQIEGFLFAPAEPHMGLLAGETIIQVFRAGSVHAADVPLPTTAAQAQPALTAALKDQELRRLNIEVLGLPDIS